jgi:hypothetical protein
MSNFPTYNTAKSKERIGLLRDRLRFLAPVSTPTAHRGERLQYATWKDTRGNIQPMRGNEGIEADRLTAFNTRQFVVRSGSVQGVNEKMLVEDRSNEGVYFQIERIDDHPDLPHKAYKIITATRRDTNVQPVDLIPGVYMDYSQTFTNVSAAFVTVTNGTLPDPTAKTANEINQLLQVYRGGLRLVYGDNGDNGYTITTATNRITPNLAFGGETVLVTQFMEA